MTDASGQLLNLTILDWQPKEIAFSDLKRFLFFDVYKTRTYIVVYRAHEIVVVQKWMAKLQKRQVVPWFN